MIEADEEHGAGADADRQGDQVEVQERAIGVQLTVPSWGACAEATRVGVAIQPRRLGATLVLALALLAGCGSSAGSGRRPAAAIEEPDGAVTRVAPIVAAIDAHHLRGLHAHPFENREHLLPQQGDGWYTAYDVRAAGSRSRGPQRLIVGRDGKVWFTADHYDHFVRLR